MSIPLISDLIEAIDSLKYYSSQEEGIRQEYGDCDRQLLDVFACRLIAEYSISVINKESSEYIECLEQKYNAVVQLRSLLANAQKEAKLVAQKAHREAYTRKMKEEFDLIPNSIHEKLEINFNFLTGDWSYVLEY